MCPCGGKRKARCACKMKKLGGGSRHWIQKAIGHPGALHRMLGVPQGKKLTKKELARGLHARNPLERKRARLAVTLKKIRGGGTDMIPGDRFH